MSAITTENPFVGLRPFEVDESLFFFGRQDQTIELLQRLHEHHFVGIVGSSGCGKSSLIRAGLIPGLKAGYLVNERDKWVIPIFKPGERPLYNFVAAILGELHKNISPPTVNEYVQKIKEEGVDIIIELLHSTFNENRSNVFVLVDQFEELFRFSMDTKDAAKKDEAIDFVNILLELAGNTMLPVYLAITMRSDFIGDCAQFFGLPEALNKSQYLVPRLSREKLKNAIEGPVRLYGGTINPALTTRLLNDLQTVQDELPLLQHCLMRTWDHEMKTDRNGELDLEDYIMTGGIENALSKHADEAWSGLTNEEQNIAELMFRALTATDHGGRKIRRPAHLDELIKLTGATSESINKVINHFNDDKRCFLVINNSIDANNPLIDISHESLIRQWEKLVGWVDKETESAKAYLRLSEAAKLHEAKQKDLLSGAELQVAMNWQTKQVPNAVWAARYNDNYEETLLFLERSKTQETRKRNTSRIKRIIYGVVAALLIATLAISYLSRMREQRAQRGELMALMAANEADAARSKADSSAHVAQLARDAAFMAKREADSSAKVAYVQKQIAEQNEKEATRQKKMADTARKVAVQQEKVAQEEKMIAEAERSKARANADSIKSLLDAINSQAYYATADSIAAAKSKLFTERALKNIDLVINQTNDTASITKLTSIRNELNAGINPEKNNNKLIHSVTAKQVKEIVPLASTENVAQFVAAFNMVMDKYEINTVNRIAAFLAQVAHETGSFYFLKELASGAAYEGRKDLGNTEPGDGVKYKGRGLIMLTGKANYSHFSNPPEYDLINHPELLSGFYVATDVTCRWWNERRLNELADKDDLPSMRKKISGASGSALISVTNFYFRAKQVLGK